MSDGQVEGTVGQLVAERPQRSRVFETLGIDYCCGGKKPLAQACHEKGLDPAAVRRLLDAEAGPASPADADADWSRATLTALADHIQQTHHAYLKRELPRLSAMVRKVAAVHGTNFNWLLELDGVFAAFAAEMQSHMMKEDAVLFPMIRALDRGELAATDHCGGSIANPIRVMEHEHDDAGRALERMRELSGGFVPPAGACNTFRATLSGLAELTDDTHRHVHKENSILFPRAAERETGLRA
jgi:regulator of cell morphogenesis and NO signaling